MSQPSDEVLVLPLLGQVFNPKDPENLLTEEFTITLKTTRNDLRARLANYNLPISGPRAVLVERLREFAKDRNAWLSLFHPQKKRTRGVHTARDSLSTRRIAEQFGTEQESLVFRSKKSVSRVQRAFDDNDRAANDGWARGVLRAFGIDNSDTLNPIPRKRQRTSSTTAGARDALATSSEHATTSTFEMALIAQISHIERSVFSARENVAQRLDDIEDTFTAHLTDLTNHLQGANSTRTAASSLNAAAASIPSCSDDPSSNTPIPTQFQPSVTPSEPPAPHENAIPIEDCGKVQLGDDLFYFSKSNVPDPPAIHFSKDVDRLFREWEESSLLRVEGRHIPIKYWPEFYKRSKGIKPNAWSTLRTKWDNWKFVVMERQAHPDEASFWRKFSSPDGQRLTYQKILDRLREERHVQTAKHAANARAFFDGNLDHPNAAGAFRYLKSGKSLLCTDDDAVAQRWLKLLQDRPDVAAQWSTRVQQPPRS